MNDYFRQLQTALAQLDDDQLEALLALCKRTIARGGTLWLAGNGGSAAVALHWACDLSKAAGVRAQALGSNPAVLTAWANDASYGLAVAMELSRLARPEDALICLSCSGTSKNIWGALQRAAQIGIPTALVMGPPKTLRDVPPPFNILVNVPHDDYGVAEDCFAAIGHWLTYELRASK